jgi:hypothetical protein
MILKFGSVPLTQVLKGNGIGNHLATLSYIPIGMMVSLAMVLERTAWTCGLTKEPGMMQIVIIQAMLMPHSVKSCTNVIENIRKFSATVIYSINLIFVV